MPSDAPVAETPPSGTGFGHIAPPSDMLEAALAEHAFALEVPLVGPPAKDLRPWFPPVFDQGNTNACSANAVAATIFYHRAMAGLPNPAPPSRSFLYFYDRQLSHITNPDGGGSILAAIQGAQQDGYCFEILWPYNPAAFGTVPDAAARADAATHHVVQYQPAQGLAQIKTALSAGYPVAFGMMLFNSFYQADFNKGIVPVPAPGEAWNGHAGVFAGFRADGRLIMRNSWGLLRPDGNARGDGGDYYLPPEYVTSGYISDSWTIMGLNG